ncbi:MAG TPA: hypothetical protein VF796_15185 [Humisphaera sp.]
MFVNLHNRDRGNIGDWECAPANYFPDLIGRVGHLADARAEDLRGNDVILGGGGLLNDFFGRFVAPLATARRRIAWGAGHNEHGVSSPVPLPAWAAKFEVLGVRDWGTPFRWVPCPSCLSPHFDALHPITRHAVHFEHQMRNIDLGLPKVRNDARDFARVVAHLASAEVVVTSSYHGAYWAMLLARRVVVIDSFSSKFFSFKRQPPVVRGMDWMAAAKDCSDNAGFLAECRQATADFAADVFGPRPAVGGR